MLRTKFVILTLFFTSSIIIGQVLFDDYKFHGKKDGTYDIAMFNNWLVSSVSFDQNFGRRSNNIYEDMKRGYFNPITSRIGLNEIRWKKTGYYIVDTLNNQIDTNNYELFLYTTKNLYYGKKSGPLWSIYDKNLKLIYKPLYKDIYVFDDSLYTAIARIDDKFGLINKKGHIVSDYEYDYMCPFKESNMIKAIKGNLDYLLKLDGSIIAKGPSLNIDDINFSPDRFNYRGSYYFMISFDNKVKAIDINGNTILNGSEFLQYSNCANEKFYGFTFEKDGLKGLAFDNKVCYPLRNSTFHKLFLLDGKPMVLFRYFNKYFLYDVHNCKIAIDDIQGFYNPNFVRLNDKWQRLSLKDLSEKKKYTLIPEEIKVGFKNYFKFIQNGKYGIMDQNDSIFLEPIYNSITSHENGNISVILDSRHFILGHNFLQISHEELEFVYPHYYDQKYIKISKLGKIFLMDHLGNLTEVIESQPSKIDFDFKNGKFKKLSINTFVGLVDTVGNVILKPEYDIVSALEYKNDTSYLFYFRKKDQRGFLTKDTFLYPLNIDSYRNLRNGFVTITELNQQSYIINFIKKIKSESFEKIEVLTNFKNFNYFSCYRSNKYFLLDQNLNYVFKDSFEHIEIKYLFDSVYIQTTKDNLVALRFLNRTVIDYKYNSIDLFWAFNNKYGIVINKEKYGLINSDGKVLIPVKYDLLRFSSKYNCILAFKNKKLYKYDNKFKRLKG